MSNTYKAFASDSGDFITLVYPNGREEHHELYHEGNRVTFEALPYAQNDERLPFLWDEIERLNEELYGSDELSKPFPDLNKDCVQRVIQLNKTVKNRAGELFPEGTLMVITQRHKRDKEVTIRPLNGSIRVSEDDCDFIGDKSLIGLSEQQ